MKGRRKKERKKERRKERKKEKKERKKVRKVTTRCNSNTLYSCRISALCVPGLSIDLEVSCIAS